MQEEGKSTDVGTDSKLNSDLGTEVSFEPNQVTVFEQEAGQYTANNKKKALFR